jgi:WD40 repeat protein
MLNSPLRKMIVGAMALALLSLMAGLGQTQREANSQPIQKEALVTALKQLHLGDSQALIVKEVRARGVDFELTPDVEKELRKAGARDELLGAVRNNFHPPIHRTITRSIPLRAFQETNGIFFKAIFSPDGKTIASCGGADGTIKLWEVSTGVLSQLTGHKESVESIAFTSDGKFLASSGFDDTLRIWDLATGQARTISADNSFSRSIVFSPDGKILATSPGDSGVIKLWDVATGTVLHNLSGRSGFIVSIAFSPEGHMLGSASDRDTVQLWAVDKDQPLFALTNFKRPSQVGFTPDGIILAANGVGDTIGFWDAMTGKPLRPFDTSPQGPNHFAFSPDGKIIATCGLELIKLRAGETVSGASEMRFSDGKPVAAGFESIKLWDRATNNLIRTFVTGIVDSISFSPDSKKLVSADRKGTISIWDISSQSNQGESRSRQRTRF